MNLQFTVDCARYRKDAVLRHLLSARNAAYNNGWDCADSITRMAHRRIKYLKHGGVLQITNPNPPLFGPAWGKP